MAKQKNPRVFELAKELGVTAKDILEKCKAEDIDVKGHMSSVTLGLATTIREWFSDGGVATAVETAAPVDVARVRKKAVRKPARKKAAARSKDAEDVTPVADSDTAVATAAKAPADKPAHSPAEAMPVDAQTSGKTSEAKAPDSSAVVVDSDSEATVAPAAKAGTVSTDAPTPANKEKQTGAASPARKAHRDADTDQDDDADSTAPPRKGRDSTTPASTRPKFVMNVPDRPKIVKPVGPMLATPTKTKLAGPKVIRVEAPDVLPAPRSRRDAGDDARGGARGGRGSTGYGAGTSSDDASRGTTSRRNKRRTGGQGAGTEPPAKRTTRGEGDQNFNWREQDLLEREERLNRSGGFFRIHRRDIQKRSDRPMNRQQSAAETGGAVAISEPITVKSLSSTTGVKAADIVRRMFLAGKPTNINAVITSEDAIEVMLEFGIELDVTEQKTAREQIRETFADRVAQDERLRPPVVTILGHVDHGKTSLLDRIRNANVAEGEAGGITQATSAFRVPVKAGDAERQIVFLDTPGHEAFTEMRARGARVTDLVVLVVAADDGVMPQTVESINHAKAAGVPLIVALNKIDKPEATDQNIQRILGQLAEHELNPSEWGGSTEVVRTSAISGDGVQELLDLIDYQAQLHEWKADFKGDAVGAVIEAQMAEGRGPVARILVQQGMLRKGDFIVMGRAFGRVRDIIDDHGERIEEAGPSTPVAISGIDEVPDAGDSFYVAKTLKAAEAAANERRHAQRERDLATPKVTLDNIFERLAESGKKELRLIVKADVQGSVETLRNTLSEMKVEEVTINVLHAAVGGINESDISLAAASEAIIIGFNVTSSAKARQAAEHKRIDIRLYDVIYNITDDVGKAARGLLDPVHRLEVLGHAEVRQVFRITRVGMIAGCYVTDGVIQRNAQIRVTRNDIVVEKDRRLEQLKRFKDDAKEVRAGQECGMKIDGYDDIKEGDILECYRTVEVERT